jgi:hypothetical protein
VQWRNGPPGARPNKPDQGLIVGYLSQAWAGEPLRALTSIGIAEQGAPRHQTNAPAGRSQISEGEMRPPEDGISGRIFATGRCERRRPSFRLASTLKQG